VDDAAGFAIGLSRLAALAWANLRRVEAELRSAAMEAELSAAGRMQGLLLPPREGAHGPFRYAGQSRPGRYVGGDFFDVIALTDDRLAVAVGDVSGKGVEAAVLIIASQGFLHAALHEHGDPGRAVTELNRYVFPRCPAGKFITLWIGVLDRTTMTMQAVDAGHGAGYRAQPGHHL
jgi:sigma-B regulation protein RsbU (phosphoserine phosphatase)